MQQRAGRKSNCLKLLSMDSYCVQKQWTLTYIWTLGKRLVCITIIRQTTISKSVNSAELLPTESPSLWVTEEETTFRTPQILTPVPSEAVCPCPLGGQSLCVFDGEITYVQVRGQVLGVLSRSISSSRSSLVFWSFFKQQPHGRLLLCLEAVGLAARCFEAAHLFKNQLCPNTQTVQGRQQVKRMATQVEVKEPIDLKRCRSKK